MRTSLRKNVEITNKQIIYMQITNEDCHKQIKPKFWEIRKKWTNL